MLSNDFQLIESFVNKILDFLIKEIESRERERVREMDFLVFACYKKCS